MSSYDVKSVSMSVRLYVHKKVFPNLTKFGMWVEIGEWYAIWVSPRSRSRRSESCENDRFQSLSLPLVM